MYQGAKESSLTERAMSVGSQTYQRLIMFIKKLVICLHVYMVITLPMTEGQRSTQ
jgi:hypothetical protein